MLKSKSILPPTRISLLIRFEKEGINLEMKIYRVEGEDIKPLSKTHYGIFTDGDVYIVDLGIKVFVWKGNKSSPGEAFIGAFFTKMMVKERPKKAHVFHVQQGEEPQEFLDLFDRFINVKEGSVPSTLAKPSVEFDKKMYLISSSEYEEPLIALPLKKENLWSDHVIMVDAFHKIFIWIGNNSKHQERYLGRSIARILWRERAGRPKIIVLDEGDESKDFFAVFEEPITVREEVISEPEPIVEAEVISEPEPIPEAEVALESETYPGILTKPVIKLERKMYLVSEERSEEDPLIELPLDKDNLQSERVVIIDASDKIYVWLGKTSHPQDRYLGAGMARRLWREKAGRAKIITLDEGSETREFSEFLKELVSVKEKPATEISVKPDIRYERKMYLVLREKGEEDPLEEIPLDKDNLQSEWVVLIDASDKIYVWIGKTSNPQDRYFGAGMARRLWREKAGRAKIITLDEGSETEEFLTLF